MREWNCFKILELKDALSSPDTRSMLGHHREKSAWLYLIPCLRGHEKGKKDIKGQEKKTKKKNKCRVLKLSVLKKWGGGVVSLSRKGRAPRGKGPETCQPRFKGK